MNSGCICCSLAGNFGEALKKVMDQFHPDRILIEPSGVGKLSDVIRAVQGVAEHVPEMVPGCAAALADTAKCKVYLKNFGKFYDDGWSGKNFERPAVQRAEAGTVNVPASSFLRPLRRSGLRQHVLNQDPVALGRLVDHHVGHRPHNLPVLQNRAAAHE